jgi:hypothetical protein
MAMRWLLVGVLLLAGCVDTRPTCEVACSNQFRCGLTPSESACTPMCSASFASSSMDCRLATDAYQRCWAGAGSCPGSLSTAAPGCSAEFNEMRLSCTGGGLMPLLESGI